MPHKPRMFLPGVPAHIVQRGHNRSACFFADEDYHTYLTCLGEGCRRYHVAIHSYCLMTNHVHLLITPQTEDGFSQLMQVVNRRYVRYINHTYRRSGTLWEGRYKASLIDAERYLLTCYRYIEMNPVVANMVHAPEQYRWSSYRCNGWGNPDDVVTAHLQYLALANSPNTRQVAYRALFQARLPEVDIHQIRNCLDYNHPLGNDRFRQYIESALGRSIGYKARGRPKRRTEPA